jgi:phosphoribosylformimino-5-aminoimidazole carboxamide ribotide isomerase
MIHIVPSILVKDGKCALIKNDSADQYTFLKEKPLDLALKFEDHGIKKIQLIDLDGVITDTVKNLHTLSDISAFTTLEIAFGGGVNTDAEIRLAFEYGAHQVSCSTLPSREKELFGAWLVSYGRNKLILGVDAIDQKVNIYGESRKQAKEDVLDYIDYFYQFSVLYIKCNTLSGDESSVGPNFDLYNKINNRFPDLKLIASGDIRSIDDLVRLQEQGIYAAVLGNALYDGSISFEELKKFTL